jgi:hypothetical protein
MAEQKAQTDWEAIERAFRANQLSLREIGRKFGVTDGAIRKRAKKEGWQRDLGDLVRKEVREKLVRRSVRTPNADPKQAVDEASDVGVTVVECHRRDIQNLARLEAKLLAELEDQPTKLYITQYQGEIVRAEVGIAVTERASALQALAGVQHKRIQLERQAYNLDEKEGPFSDLESVLAEVAQRSSSLVKDGEDE